MSRPRLTLIALALASGIAAAQTTTPPPGTLRQYLKLKQQTLPPETPTDVDAERGDPLGLAIVLPETRGTLATAIARAPTALLGSLKSAEQAFATAEKKLHEGAGTDGSMQFMVGAMQDMGTGQGAMDQALDIANGLDPVTIGLLLPAVQKIREAASRMSQAQIDLAIAAGVPTSRLAPALEAQRVGDALHAAGDYGPAVGQYAMGFGLAANTVTFDVGRFEQNLRSVFDNESVGWSYAITVGGQLARSGSKGLARTGADQPATAQSSSKKMHVASISKTMTAIVLLRLLADRGLSVDSAIGPWLPAGWVRGNGVDSISFRQLLTHRSGFGQNAPGSNQYASLQTMVGNNVPFKGDFDYENANFGLMRVLVSKLAGVDPSQVAGDPAALSAAVFMARATNQFNVIGVPFSCDPEPGKPTLQYQFPDSGNPGYVEPPSGLACGGFGVQISARNLVRTLAYLRYTQDLMPSTMFQQMKAGYLGFMNPAQYGFAQGAFGVYHGHGGDWDHTGWGGLDTCAYMFPIHVEAAVLVNSSRKAAGGSYTHGPHQCGVLKWAFDNAWTAN